MNSTAFNEALAELAASKGISKLGGSKEGLEDPIVNVDIDPNTGKITLENIKRVVPEVEDDYLEISEEDANAGLKKKKYKAGDDYVIPCPIEQLSKLTAMSVKNLLRQKIAEAERSALYEVYKDHIGEMVTGTVEKSDDRSVLVDIGRTKVELTRREMIGDEYFKIGDQIKVYIQEVKSAHPEEKKEGVKPRGPQIEVTRSSEGFLKRLFEEEIREIYDGTVVIKGIAREAGIRSKVAVYSANDDIDATGACIGPGGTRIQKIVAQLGNGKEKEKIDVINYSSNPAVFIIEAVRPATVVGVALTEPDATPMPRAVAVIRDGQLSIGIGRRATNARLASRLTGWSVDVKEESTAKELGIQYISSEEWIARDEAERREREKEAYLAKARAEAERKAKEAEEAKPVIKEEPIAAPISEQPAPVAPKAKAKPEEFPAEAMNPVAAALEADRKAKEEAARQEALKAEEEAKKEEKPTEPTFVQTTTSISDLEKELESAKEKKSKPVSKKRPRKITEEEVENVAAPTVQAQPAMPIYSEEEMAEIAAAEAEEANDSDLDEDIDYEEYDRYYDDDEGGRR